MLAFRQFNEGKYLYHHTHPKNVEGIAKHGLIPSVRPQTATIKGKPVNWFSNDRKWLMNRHPWAWEKDKKGKLHTAMMRVKKKHISNIEDLDGISVSADHVSPEHIQLRTKNLIFNRWKHLNR